MISFLFFAQAAIAAPAPPPVRAPVLSESVIRCSVFDEEGIKRALEFRTSGRDGRPNFTVVFDETGSFAAGVELYDNVNLGSYGGRWRDNRLARFAEDGNSLTSARFFPGKNSVAAVVLERQSQPLMDAAPVFGFAGTCREAGISKQEVSK